MEGVDGYVRVSRVAGREGESYISPTVQREAIERWAAYKNVPVLMWHVDEDQSGGAASRPGLDAAVERAVTGQSAGIVAARIDRFSRLTEQGLRDLRRLSEAGARLAFVTEDIDTSSPVGKMIYTIMLAQAEYFLEQIKASWIVAKDRAVKRGAYVGPTPFGYVRGEDQTLVPDPVTAPIVTEAFRLAAANSLQAAKQHLEKTWPARGWNMTQTRRIIEGESYLGNTRNGSMYQADTHPPLVSRPIWEAAQSSPRSMGPPATFPLSGLMLCQTCGSPLTGTRGPKKERTYYCSGRKGPDTCTAGATIIAKRVEEYVREQAAEYLDGLTLTIGNPDMDGLTLLERAMSEAQAELDAFASDLTLRRVLGDRYHEHLQERVDAVTAARDAYRRRARDAATSRTFTLQDVLAEDDPVAYRLLLGRIFLAIVVNPGRKLPIDDKVWLFPVDAYGAAGEPGAV